MNINIGALVALKGNDLQAFTDILNTKDVEEGVRDQVSWIYSPIKSEKSLNLVELCVEEDNLEFIRTLVRLGVHSHLLNTITGYAPLHRAVLLGKHEIVKLFIDNSRTEFDVNSRSGRLKRGYTALHLVADNPTDNHLQCLDILLGCEGIDVNCLDCSSTVSPLYLAAKKKNESAVRKLIENGAAFDIKVGRTSKTVEDFIKENLPQLQLRTIRVKKPRQREDNVKERMITIVSNVSPDSLNLHQLFLEFRHLSLSVHDASRGFEDLVEKCCRKGLHDFAQVLFNKNADPNRFGSGSLSCPILDAAERSDYRLAQVLVRAGAEMSQVKERTEETVLHCLLKNYNKDIEEDFSRFLEILFNKDDIKIRRSIDLVLNRKDLTGVTPLHYATEKCSQNVVRALLRRGANIGIKNMWGEIPISRICPRLLEEFLDQDCIIGDGEVHDKEFSLTFKYSFLAPDPQSLPEPYRPPLELDEALQPLNQEVNKINDNKERKTALPETESLWYMGQSKQHRHLLKHPVITSFLWFKWERMRPYFNRNLRLYLLYVFILTWFIFEQFGGVGQKPAIRDAFFVLYIALCILTTLLIIKDWTRDLKEIISSPQKEDPDYGVRSSRRGQGLVSQMTSNIPDILQISGMVCIFFIQPSHLNIPLIVLLCILVLRELLQLLVSMKRYLCSLENWIEVAMIVLVVYILCNNTEDDFAVNRHLAAIALVFSWTELITMIGRHPKLHHLNIYVTMFYKVLNSFLLFLMWFSMFIVAFGLGFYIMLHTDTVTDISGLEDEDKNPLFNKTWLSLVKTSAMFVGELEFSDLPIDSSGYLGMLAYCYFLSFVFLIVVVLMNLLNGLAVSDTGDIKAKAEIYSYISRVETISYMESTLLGDPFDFLSNVPEFLKSIPSISLIRQCYRTGFCRKVFKTGAKGFLLFYTVLPDKEFTVKPNHLGAMCSLQQDQIGEGILVSAKEIVLKNRSQDSYDTTELADLREKLFNLETEINGKLDLLIRKR
ncbi:transient receptor potential cation channel protein painless [Eurytemora carolleeae]|uniref:transient receptor potential cation channel protein painless n=1 Tax=Eurytemora carolleeae TaxID=1294199 RepID=UPI000C7568AE|nr:transient receptor potential cation channel protein painless [Eurytemora carolleeae]|eukprot:XP_023324174.1 transient receptor potential cation channel protein painless-like [Eurytemora affinis]